MLLQDTVCVCAEATLASIMAASLYFLTFLTILIATYVLCFLSQHSRTRPNVPAVLYSEPTQGMSKELTAAQQNKRDSPSPILLRILSASQRVAPQFQQDYNRKDAGCQEIQTAYILSSNCRQAERHSVRPVAQQKDSESGCHIPLHHSCRTHTVFRWV